MQNHLELTRLFVLNLHNKQVNLEGVDFELLADTISDATCIPAIGEKWFKKAKLDKDYYEPFFKTRYRQFESLFFPSHTSNRDLHP